MTLDLLVCPGCRTWTDERIDVRTLEPSGDELACECGRRYPIVDGIPLLAPAPEIEPDLALDTAAVEAGPDDAAYPRLVEHLSIYLDAHWGDRATPPPDGPGAGFALGSLLEHIARLPRVACAVELGCSVGRIVAELPAERVIGLDLHLGALRRARRLLAGETVTYARRMVGRVYSEATCTAGPLARDARLAYADVLDPPLVPGAFDRVVALNLLDSVAHPRTLIAVIDGLCAPGGEVIVSSPYAWQSSVLHDDARLGGADPAGAVSTLWRDRGYAVAEDAELPWTLRRDARSAVTYQTHFLRLRKGT